MISDQWETNYDRVANDFDGDIEELNQSEE